MDGAASQGGRDGAAGGRVGGRAPRRRAAPRGRATVPQAPTRRYQLALMMNSCWSCALRSRALGRAHAGARGAGVGYHSSVAAAAAAGGARHLPPLTHCTPFQMPGPLLQPLPGLQPAAGAEPHGRPHYAGVGGKG
jgi:hypothetical protein